MEAPSQSQKNTEMGLNQSTDKERICLIDCELQLSQTPETSLLLINTRALSYTYKGEREYDIQKLHCNFTCVIYLLIYLTYVSSCNIGGLRQRYRS